MSKKKGKIENAPPREPAAARTDGLDFGRYEKQLRLITDALPVLISYIDAGRRYRFVNRGYTEWFGVPPEKMIGAHMREVLGARAYGEIEAFIERVLAGEKVSFDHVIATRGGERFVHVQYTPEIDPETGAVGGFYSLVNDVSENRRVEARLRQSEERLRIATEAAEIFAWEVDLATGAAKWSENTARIIGEPPEADALFFVLPEERGRLGAEFEKAIADGAESFDFEFRGLNRLGEERHWRAQSTLVRDGDGRPRRSVGITQDVTDEKRREADRHFLHELGETLRYGGLASAALLREVTQKTCRHLGAARCLFIEIDEPADRGLIRHEYVKAGLATVAGEYKISDYSAETVGEARRGKTIVNCDAERDPRTAERFAEIYEPYDERAYVSVPLFTGGRWTAIFWISDDRPRRWTESEIALIETAGERAWLAVEKLRSEEELRKNREHLQMAMSAADICSWEVDLAADRIEWSDNVEPVIGFALPSGPSRLLGEFLHPDDRHSTAAAYTAWKSGRRTAGVELRIVEPASGREVWVYAQGVPVRGAGGERGRLVGILQNITSRKSVQHQLEELLRREQAARRAAEETSRLKDEFLTTVSHELRTPLNSILGWSQMLASGRIGEEQRAAAVASIHRNAQMQARLIEDLLDVSRIITGKLRLDINPTPLAPLIETAVESLRPALDAKNLRLALDFAAEEEARVDGDATRLQQVFWNLLSNAIKFTPVGGLIGVRLEVAEQRTQVTISDDGAGIAPEFLPHVFDRFSQADGSSTRKHGGLGLGLAIVRHLVELHGGTVAARSEGTGRGAAFTVALPRSKAAAVRRPKGKLVDWLGLEIVPSAPAPAAPERLDGLRVLLVDDERDTLEMLTALLEGRGARVRSAASVAEAFGALDGWLPDVIVSDIAMPHENGFAFLEQLRRRPPEAGGRRPVVALTAFGGERERGRALAAGFAQYLAKPVEADALVSALRRLAATPENAT